VAPRDFAVLPATPYQILIAESRPISTTSPPDARLHILEVLWRTDSYALHINGGARSSSSRVQALARCQRSRTSESRGRRTDVGQGQGTSEDLVMVLFSFASPKNAHSNRLDLSISSPVGFEQGCDVLVWKPWCEIGAPDAKCMRSQDVETQTTTESNQSGAESDNVMQTDTPPLPDQNEKTLFCSRFVIVRT
jgi:hypothetical protein